MAETSCQRQVNFDTYSDVADDMLVYSGTTGYVHTKYTRINSSLVVTNENGNNYFYGQFNNFDLFFLLVLLNLALCRRNIQKVILPKPVNFILSVHQYTNDGHVVCI